MKKSVISLLLAVLMVFSMFPLGAFAAETDAADTSADAVVAEAAADTDTQPAEAPEDAGLADTGSDEDIADTGAITVTGPIGVTGVTEPKNGYYPSYTGVSVLNSSEYKINSSYTYGSYKNGIMWKDENGDYINPSSAPAFQTGKKYTVVIFLVPASSSYVFDQNAIKAKTNTVNGNAATKVGFWNNNEMYLEYTFTAYRRLTYVSANISVPVPGNTPSYSCTVGDSSAYYATGSDSYYKNGIKWVEDGTDMTVSSGKKFVAGKKYTVYIALKPQTNYKFAPKASLSGDINGNTATVGQWTEGSYIYLTKEYTCTAQKISTVNITGVTAPKIGATPSYAATVPSGLGYKKEDHNNSSSGWTSGVCWVDSNGNNMTSSSKFEAGKAYKVRVSIIRTSEAYEFSSSVAVKINGNTATVATWGGIPKTENFIAEYTFPTLTNTKVSTASLYGFTAPTIGAKPVYQINSGMLGCHVDTSALSYSTNGVYWKDETANTIMSSTDTFKANHVYSIGTALTADTGYEFAVSGSSPAVSVKFDGKAATGTGSVSGKQPSKTLCAWYIFPVLTTTKISNVYILNVTEPKPGNSPVFSAYAGSTQYKMDTYSHAGSGWKSGVKWVDESGNYMNTDGSDKFVAGKKYTVKVSVLRMSEAYEFTSSTKGTINGNTATVTPWSSSWPINIVLSYTFTCSGTAVSSVQAVNVTVPVAGQKPTYSATPNGLGYGIKTDMEGEQVYSGVQWYDKTDNKHVAKDTAFKPDHEYKVTIYMYASTGYYFASSVTGKINSGTATASGIYGYDSSQVIAVSMSFGKITRSVVTSVAVTGVTAPAIGASPVYSASESGETYDIYKMNYSTGNFKNGVRWIDNTAHAQVSVSDSSYKFIVGHIYAVNVMVKVSDANRFKFSSSMTGTINGSSATVGKYEGSLDENEYRMVSFTFPALAYTEISQVYVYGVTEPAIGATPYMSAPGVGNSGMYDVYTSYSTGNFTKGVYWYDVTASKRMAATDTFQAGHKYQYNVLLYTKPGYKFKSSLTATLNASYSASLAGRSGLDDSFYREVYYTFPELTATDITKVSVTNVAAPSAGETPNYTTPTVGDSGKYSVYTALDNSKFTKGVYWYDVSNSKVMKSTDKFVSGNKYTYNVVLKAASGYKFAASGSISGTVNGANASIAGMSGYSRDDYVELYYSFTATKSISYFRLTVTDPITLEAPVWKATVPSGANYEVENFNTTGGYKNGVLWKDSSGNYIDPADTSYKFEKGKKYTVKVSLVPKADYSFALTGINGMINGEECTAKAYSSDPVKAAKNIYLEYTFTCVDANLLKSFEADIRTPFPGESPNYVATIPAYQGYDIEDYNSSSYKAGITWKDATNNATISPTDSSFKFAKGNKYTVRISLVPGTGNRFATSGLTGKINGVSCTAAAYGALTAKMNIYLEYTFTCVEPYVLGGLRISVTAPEAGKSPVYSASTTDSGYRVENYNSTFFKNGVSWYDSDGSSIKVADADSFKFEGGKNYKVRVSLLPTNGNKFNSSGASGKINGNTATSGSWGSPEWNIYLEYTFTCPVPAGSRTVSGQQESFLSDTDKVTIALYKGSSTTASYSTTATGKKSSYSISGVAVGTYVMKVSKKNHATREYEVIVGSSNVTQNVKIHPIGDITGDGLTNAADAALALRFIRKLETPDKYQVACGDINNTKTVDAGDVAKMLRHLRKIEPLY